MTNLLFVELIKAALGRRKSLSALPSEKQWYKLFELAQQQAIAGVCFAGVQRQKELGVCPPTQLYYEWLAVAGMIQQQNELLNQESAEICRLVADGGYKSCVLKGQAVASLYDEELRMLRQSGDIDVWMLALPKEVIAWGRGTGRIYYYDYHHADLDYFKETEVELHYRPTLSRNLLRNARLQRWFRLELDKLIVDSEDLGFAMPRADFNLILTLNHNFWHLLYEGVGLRQMMDLYFVLRSRTEITEITKIEKLLKYFMLLRFARACMWVMQEVFGLERQYMVCEPDERSGRFLLNEIMTAGNFGQHDPRLKRGGESNRLVLLRRWLKHTFRLFGQDPSDVLWTPIGVLRISLWRRWHYMKDKQIKHDQK